MVFKLPVSSIIKNTFLFIWKNKKQLSISISLPTLVLAILAIAISSSMNLAFFFLFGLILLLATSKIAITCHRLVLIGATSRTPRSISFKEVYFCFWSIAVYFITTFSFNAIAMIIEYLVLPLDNISFQLLLAIASSYLLGRFSLIFPAIAVDKRVSIKWAWNVSRGNGFRMIVIVALLPLLAGQALMSAVSFLIPHSEKISDPIQLIPVYIAALLLFIIEVIALSFSYKAFENYFIAQREHSQMNKNHPSE